MIIQRRIYISGPMEGKRNHNVAAFNKMEKKLKDMGYSPSNPVDIEVDSHFMVASNPTRQDFYRKDFRELTYCNAIMMLKGWNTSHGAQLERLIALEMGLTIHYEDEIEDGVIRKR